MIIIYLHIIHWYKLSSENFFLSFFPWRLNWTETSFVKQVLIMQFTTDLACIPPQSLRILIKLTFSSCDEDSNSSISVRSSKVFKGNWGRLLSLNSGATFSAFCLQCFFSKRISSLVSANSLWRISFPVLFCITFLSITESIFVTFSSKDESFCSTFSNFDTSIDTISSGRGGVFANEDSPTRKYNYECSEIRR